MERFRFYTRKIDEIHVIDMDAVRDTGKERTLCGEDFSSASYFENDRYKNIDASRRIDRGHCPDCLQRMIQRANTDLHNLQVENNCRASMNEKLEAEKAKLMSEEQMRKEHPLVTISTGKPTPPICIEGEHQELYEDGPFMDGQSIEDIPKCAIPGCTNEEVRYWIHPKGKDIKYFCGDCPQSKIEVLDKFAASIGEEVGAYDEPVWAVQMLYRAPEDDTRTWLIQAHNMATAIARARDGDYDVELDNGPGLAQGEFIPVDIRESDEDEKGEFTHQCG